MGTTIVFVIEVSLPSKDEMSPLQVRQADRLRAVGEALADGEPYLDGPHLNDAIRSLQDLLLTFRRAKAAAHNRDEGATDAGGGSDDDDGGGGH